MKTEELIKAKKYIEHAILTIKHDGHLGTIQTDWILPDLEKALAAIVGYECSSDADKLSVEKLQEHLLPYKKETVQKIIDEKMQLVTADEFVKLHPMGYDMPIGERGAGLSGGQRQSVGIARALVNNSNIWLFDEPTNAMDQTSETNILNNLKENIENKTLLLVTQKMNMLDLATRIIVMNNGQKVLDGEKMEIIKKLGVNNG